MYSQTPTNWINPYSLPSPLNTSLEQSHNATLLDRVEQQQHHHQQHLDDHLSQAGFADEEESSSEDELPDLDTVMDDVTASEFYDQFGQDEFIRTKQMTGSDRRSALENGSNVISEMLKEAARLEQERPVAEIDLPPHLEELPPYAHKQPTHIRFDDSGQQQQHTTTRPSIAGLASLRSGYDSMAGATQFGGGVAGSGTVNPQLMWAAPQSERTDYLAFQAPSITPSSIYQTPSRSIWSTNIPIPDAPPRPASRPPPLPSLPDYFTTEEAFHSFNRASLINSYGVPTWKSYEASHDVIKSTCSMKKHTGCPYEIVAVRDQSGKGWKVVREGVEATSRSHNHEPFKFEWGLGEVEEEMEEEEEEVKVEVKPVKVEKPPTPKLSPRPTPTKPLPSSLISSFRSDKIPIAPVGGKRANIAYSPRSPPPPKLTAKAIGKSKLPDPGQYTWANRMYDDNEEYDDGYDYTDFSDFDEDETTDELDEFDGVDDDYETDEREWEDEVIAHYSLEGMELLSEDERLQLFEVDKKGRNKWRRKWDKQNQRSQSESMKYFTSHGKVRDAFATTTTTGPAFKAVSLPKLPQYSPNYWKPVPATIDDVPNCDRFVFTRYVSDMPCDSVMCSEKIIAMNLLFQETAWVEKDPVDLKEPWEFKTCLRHIECLSSVNKRAIQAIRKNGYKVPRAKYVSDSEMEAALNYWL